MNFLGHIFLSGQDEALLVGNFIGDYVKGNQYLQYPENIQKGIIFHRNIDDFTDNNQHWIQIKTLLQPVYKHYAGVVADMFVDHFLAANWHQFTETPLHWSAKWAYATLLKNHHNLPERVKAFLPFLIQHRRLQSYAEIEGIEVSLKIMSLRTSLPDHTLDAIELLNLNYKEFENYSLNFLQEIKNDLGK